MSSFVWKKLGSPYLTPSTISLKEYDGQPSKPQGLYQNVLIELSGKKVHINIKVIDVPLDYNILLGHSFMYVMKAVTSSIFSVLTFPLDGKVFTIDQLTFYEPRSSKGLENILPHIVEKPIRIPLANSCLDIFKDSPLLGIYRGTPPMKPLDVTPLMCTISTNVTPSIEENSQPDQSPPLSPVHLIAISLRETIQVPFLFPLSRIASTLVMVALQLPYLTIGLLVWHLKPPETSTTIQARLVLQPADTSRDPQTSLNKLPSLTTSNTGGNPRHIGGIIPPTHTTT